MKKIWKHLFNQNMLYILLMLVQIAFLVLSVLFLNRNYAWVYGALLLLNGLLIIYITNSRKNPTYKNAWLVVIAVLPIFGGLSYLFLKTRRDTRIFFHNYEQQMEQTKPLLVQEPDAARHLFNDSQQVYNLSTYLQHTGFPVYEQTNVTYFPLGEEQFAEMKNRLREAKRFIFIEYFIIAPGKMWDEFLEILIERARAGVEVRLMYDGFGTKFFSTGDFLKIAKQHHIQCRCFNPFRPLLSSAQNNRDHRKILVIDGRVGFTGGVNLADEYINAVDRFGHWKDAAVLITGEAAWSMTLMFQEMWAMVTGKDEDFAAYYPWQDAPCPVKGRGMVQPYGDTPLDQENVCEHVYRQILDTARDYVYITTPYLILDATMLSSLSLAAKSGVDVRIITPGIPDKKLVYQTTRSYYAPLVRRGVRIYEYTPGFIHQKQTLCDGETATVGTINFDYRSLYHHFENGVLLHGCGAIGAIGEDFAQIFEVSREVTEQYKGKRSMGLRIIQCILRLFAPLL